MGNIAATLSLNVPAITALCTGQRGSIIYTASGAPYNIYNTYLGNPGLSGDFYIDTATGFYYGPKTTTWPLKPVFTLNVPTSAYPLVLVSGLTGLVVPTYGNNTVSLFGSNLSILGGINNNLSGVNSFIIGSNLTANLTGFTIVNNLSGNNIYDIAGNSNQWNTAYTYSNITSSAYTAATNLVNTTSANWNSAYTALTSTSATWNAANTVVAGNSGNWNTSYSVVSSLAYLTYTLNGSLSAIVPSRGTNVALGITSNIGGGNNNQALSAYSSVLGGRYNTASGNYSNVTGGFSGLAAGCYSNVAGGVCNTASGYGASIGGGTSNTASGFNAAIAAGAFNTASCCSNFIGGGRFNTASGARSIVVGGFCNTASGHYSFVAGGSGNSTNNFTNTFILGSGLSASQANYTYVNNISVQGNANVTGNVGIGTTATSTALTVNGTVSANNTISAPTFTAQGSTGGFNITDRSGSSASSTLYRQLGTNYISDSVTGNLVAIASGGNVGIGISNPGTTLTVNGSISALNAINSATASVAGTSSLFSVGDRMGGASTGAFYRSGGVNYLYDSNAGNVVAYTSGGNVGIGTSSPTNKVTATSSTQYKGISVNNGTNDIVQLIGQSSINDNGSIVLLNAGTAGTYIQANGNSYINGGNLGIGTALPTQALTIVGNVSATGYLAGGTPTNIQTGNYTLQDMDCGSVIYFNNTTTLSAILPNPNTVRNGYQVTVIQAGTGTVYFNANGLTLNQSYNLKHTSTRWSAATLSYNSTFGWTLFGDLA